MFVLANLVTTVAGLLSLVINLYIFVIIVAAFLSWVNPDPYNAIVRTLRALTEPVLYRILKHLPFCPKKRDNGADKNETKYGYNDTAGDRNVNHQGK